MKRNRITTAGLALLTGSLGIHRIYLKQIGYVPFYWVAFFAHPVIAASIAMFEAFYFMLWIDDEKFNAIHNKE